MKPELTAGQVEVTTSCPCCMKTFIGYGIDEADAISDAMEKLDNHLEAEEC